MDRSTNPETNWRNQNKGFPMSSSMTLTSKLALVGTIKAGPSPQHVMNPKTEHLLRPHGLGRFVGATFLAIALSVWAVGEAFALWLLIVGAIALPSEASPGSVIGAGAFLLFWLTIWTSSGHAGFRAFLRLLWSSDVIVVGPEGVRVHHRLGPFHSVVELPRETIFGIYAIPGENTLFADTRTGPSVLSTLGSPQERFRVAAALQAEFGVSGDRGAQSHSQLRSVPKLIQSASAN
jgi:hypothetical protein